MTDARIRELLDGMPAFNIRIRKLGRTKAGRTPLPLPAPENYPAVGSLADAIAPNFSEDPNEVAFFQDMMRLQELWAYVGVLPGSARDRINGAIAQLRQLTVELVGGPPGLDVSALNALYSPMISARIAQLESITDEELQAVARHSSEIGPAMMSGLHRSKNGRKKAI